MAQNDKILCLLTSYLRKHTLYDRDCDMVNSSVKGKKMTQNDKKYVCYTLISESIHHMFVIFGTRV